MELSLATIFVTPLANELADATKLLLASARRRLRLNTSPSGRVTVSWKMAPLTPENEQLAWSTYVQLVTRVATVPLGEEQGLDREAIASLHSLFGTLRTSLLAAGPNCARHFNEEGAPLGVAIAVVLNVVLRPFLSRWHPALLHHEASKPKDGSPVAHERLWEERPAFREDLRTVQESLKVFCLALEQMLEIDGPASLQESGPLPEVP